MPNKIRGLFDRGDLIDSLDLNIGYESIQKLKVGWGFGALAKPLKLEPLKLPNQIK